MVVDSLIAPRFGDYIVEFKYKGNEDLTRNVYVPKDASKSPYNFRILDAGVD